MDEQTPLANHTQLYDEGILLLRNDSTQDISSSVTAEPYQGSTLDFMLTRYVNTTPAIDDPGPTLCNISGHHQVSLVAPISMSLLGIFGNALALFVLYRTHGELRRSVFYTLVACLATTDMLGQTVTTPIVIVAYARGGWPGGRPFCQLHGFLMVGFGLVTPLLVSLMALERVGALCCTYFTSRFLSRFRVRAALASCWVFAMGFAALPLVGFGTYEKQYPDTWCFLKFHFDRETVEEGWEADAVYSCLYAAINLLVIALSICSNVVVIAMLLRARQRRRVLTNNVVWRRTSSAARIYDGASQRRESMKKTGDLELQMVWLLCGMTLVFTCCWTPFMYQIIMSVASGASRHSATDMMVVRAAAFNQILDPWVYILLRRSLMLRVKALFRRLLGLRNAHGCGGNSSSAIASHKVSGPLNTNPWPPKTPLVKTPVVYVNVCDAHLDPVPSGGCPHLKEGIRNGRRSFKERIQELMDAEGLNKGSCYRTSAGKGPTPGGKEGKVPPNEGGAGIALLPRNLLLDNHEMPDTVVHTPYDSTTDNYLGHVGLLLREVDNQSFQEGENGRPATCAKGSA